MSMSVCLRFLIRFLVCVSVGVVNGVRMFRFYLPVLGSQVYSVGPEFYLAKHDIIM